MENILLIKQVEQLLTENNLIAALSNVSAGIMSSMDKLNWVGFYFYNQQDLILGPFQGKVACSLLKKNHGVCHEAINLKHGVIVNDVLSFSNHIACDADSRSELVVPLIFNHKIYGVLDLDSYVVNRFTEIDLDTMTQIAVLITTFLINHPNTNDFLNCYQ